MRERTPEGLRRTAMRLSVLLLVALIAAGCGGSDDKRGTSTGDTSEDCLVQTLGPRPTVKADLDGDGTAEEVQDVAGKGTNGCVSDYLAADVAGKVRRVPITGDLELGQSGLQAVALPDRKGDLVLVKLTHPRGGFQARLYGYADGKLEELKAEGRPIIDFVATDSASTPTAAHCVADGFDVVQARRHEPMGVVAAWDVYRTTYSVDGNQVTQGASREVADNVLDVDFQSGDYGDLIDYPLFENCLAKH